MFGHWTTYLLIVSLSLNVGGVTTLLYFRFQNRQPSTLNQETPPPALRELVTLLNLDPEQREIFQKIFSFHRQNTQVWHQELNLKRQELLVLFKDGRTAWPEYQVKLKELEISLKGKASAFFPAIATTFEAGATGRLQ